MTQKRLDHANIDLLFKQMSREGMSQRMGCHSFFDLGTAGRRMNYAVELACRKMVGRVLTGKQPDPWSRDTIPLT
jgi:hypothetical protein